MKSILFFILIFAATFLSTFANNTCNGFSVDIVAIGNTTLCTGDSVILQATAGTTFNWNNGQQTPSIVVNQAGVFNVVVQDANNCIAISPTITISVLNAFEAEIVLNGDSIICDNENIILQSNINNNFSWNTGDVTQAIITNQPGTYILTVTDNFGCEVDVDQVTLVEQTTEPVDVFTNDPTIFCQGVNINVFVDIPETYNYNWNIGGADSFINVATSGNYYVFGNDPTTGCDFFSDTVTVEVGQPVEPIVTFIGDTILCQGDSIILNSSESFAYFWTNEETTQQTIVKDTGGLFTVTTADFFGCSVTSDSLNIIYEPNLTELTFFGDSLITIGEEFQYFTDAPEHYIFDWTATGGIIDANGEPFVNVIWDNSNQEKTICTQITSQQNCTAFEKCLNINLTTNINESFYKDVTILPNPANNFIKINTNNNFEIENIKIFNAAGKLVVTQKTNLVDVSTFKSGNYFAKIIFNKGVVVKDFLVLR